MRCKGFTLVEILFVVLIAAGVIAFAVPAYKRMQERAAYNAASGVLLDVGNAVSALQRDLQIASGENSIPFPSGATSWDAATSGSFSQAISDGTPWNKWLADHAGGGATWDAQFWGALFTFDYLKSLTNTNGYSFYVLNGSCATCCSGRCTSTTGTTVKACMCKAGTENGCYFGAVMLTDGRIERITEDNISCK